MVHALDAGTGVVLWVMDFGGETALFHFYPTLINDNDHVFLPRPGAVLAVSLADGAELWAHDNVRPLALSRSGDLYVQTSTGLALFEATTGIEIATFGSQLLGGQAIGAEIRKGQLIVSDRTGIKAYGLTDGVPTWTWTAPSPVVDLVAVTEEFVAIPTSDRIVALIEIQ